MEASKSENNVNTEVNRVNSWPDKNYHPKIYLEIFKMISDQTDVHKINTIFTDLSTAMKSLKHRRC